MTIPDAKRALVLLLGAAIPLAAQQPSGVRRPGGGAGMDYKAYESATIERGKATFAGKCGFCHGSNARGGESGPDLLRSPLVRDDEDGNQIGQVVRNGRPAAGMPKFDLTKSEISDIAAFLHEGVRAAAERGTYKLLNIVTGDPKAGEAYFNGAGQCTMCHSITGDLKGVGGKYDPVALQGKFLMPAGGRDGQKRTIAQVTVTVTLASGKSFEGTLERMDDFNIALTDANGDYHSFNRNGSIPKVELHDPLKHHYDMLSKYTDADIHNLTAYLVTLK
ncbi:MAG TPA: c-type cytochrome [Bryobacteraceae bacterium]|nr:c-type cytochrome [Bryobacteraceae bacterium]